jgi:hypothetical protein
MLVVVLFYVRSWLVCMLNLDATWLALFYAMLSPFVIDG